MDRGPAPGAPWPAVAGRTVTLGHILGVALALRLVALALPSLVHADEVFQYLEPAHRIVFDAGVTTWEWREGIRGRLLPLLIAGPMAVGGAVAPSSGLYLLLPRLVMLLASLSIVAVAWALGRRLSPLHAVVAGAIAAGWYETVYLAPHIISETVATILVLAAAPPLVDAARAGRPRLVAAGALLGVAVSVRFHYAPAIAVLAVASCWRRPGALLPLVCGGAIGLLPEAAADLAAGEIPYRWLVRNVGQNIVAGRAAAYGVSGPFGLVGVTFTRWSLWIVPLLLLAAVGARRYPALALAAITNVAVHSAIAHKEYRFITLSTTIVVVLAAIGTAEVVHWSARRHGRATARDRMRLAALGWIAASASLAFGAFRPMWTAPGGELAAAATLRADAGTCGIAIYRHDWSRTGGYAMLHRAVPLYLFEDGRGDDPERDVRMAGPAFDRILADRRRADELPSGYAAYACRERVCLYRRAGDCTPQVARRFTIDAVLARHDE